jgi:hypothetical protein
MRIIRSDRSRCSDLERIWFGDDYIGDRYLRKLSISFVLRYEVDMRFILSINFYFKNMPVVIDPRVCGGSCGRTTLLSFSAACEVIFGARKQVNLSAMVILQKLELTCKNVLC